MIFRMTERVNPFPTEKLSFFALHKHFLNGLYAKNSPPRRTRRGPPLFEKRLVPEFGLFFCAGLFLTHRMTEQSKPVPYSVLYKLNENRNFSERVNRVPYSAAGFAVTDAHFNRLRSSVSCSLCTVPSRELCSRPVTCSPVICHLARLQASVTPCRGMS